MKKLSAGFTLAEILVVVAIVAIMASVLYVNFGESQAQTRDVKRQADLRELQSAIESYKNRYGRYPAGCNNGWSGEAGSDYHCPSNNPQYIVGHDSSIKFVPEFISALPTDPKRNGTNSGYVYVTNADGTVYKLVALNTVEVKSVVKETNNLNTDLREFRYCDSYGGEGSIDGALCEGVEISGNGMPNHCNMNDGNNIFKKSYAVWGGYYVPPNGFLNDWITRKKIEDETENIICGSPGVFP